MCFLVIRNKTNLVREWSVGQGKSNCCGICSVILMIPIVSHFYSYGDVAITRRVLHLCHSIFLNWTPNADENDTNMLFDTFSSIINSPTQYDQSVVAIARNVIVDGRYIFMHVGCS